MTWNQRRKLGNAKTKEWEILQRKKKLEGRQSWRLQEREELSKQRFPCWVEWCPPGRCESDLIWEKGLCRCYKVKMRSCWIRQGLKFSIIGAFLRDERFGHRDIEGGGPWEDGNRNSSYMSSSQWKSRVPSNEQKLEAVRKDSSLEPLEEWPGWPWFWTSRHQNCERIHFCCFKLPSCGILLQLP